MVVIGYYVVVVLEYVGVVVECVECGEVGGCEVIGE